MTDTPQYTILTAATVVDYLKTQPRMQNYFDDFDQLKVTEITEGNVNSVFRIKQPNSQKSVILKQAMPYFRAAGEAYPLGRQRMNIEIAALASTTKHSPSTVPAIYHHSIEQSLVVMQDLRNHKMLKDVVMAGDTLPHFARHIASFLANSLYYSSDFSLSSKDKKAAVRAFINPQLCELIEDLVFTHPFQHRDEFEYNPKLPQDIINKVHKNSSVLIAASQMKYCYMTCAQAQLHGDLHIGSIMVTTEQTCVIDPEFAFYGPMGFDIGMLLGNLYMLYFLHVDKTDDYRNWLLETIEQIWQGFAYQFVHLAQPTNISCQYDNAKGDLETYTKAFLATVFTDTVGFIGCKLIRRVLGRATLPYFTAIEDLDKRASIETNIINMATTLLVNRAQYKDIGELTALAKSVQKRC